MPIYQIDIIKSLGGRGARDQWRNTYFVRAAAAIDDPILRDVALAIAQAEAAAHLSEVDILRAVIKQKAENALNRPADTFVSMALDLHGLRAVVGVTTGANGGAEVVNPMLPLEHCLEITRGAATGYNGRLLYRGCLLIDDVHTSRSNNFALKDPTVFSSLGSSGSVLVNLLNSPLPDNAVFVLPDMANVPGDPLSYFVETSRDVISHAVAGVVTISRTRRRTKAERVAISTAQREINDFARKAKKLIGNGTVADLAGELLVAYNTYKVAANAIKFGLPALEAAEVVMPLMLL